MTGTLGSRAWAFPGGHIPAESVGHEPEATSREELCLLNIGEEGAAVEVVIHHHDGDPVGPYPLSVEAGRVRHVRINDLIDPQAVPLGVPFGVVVRSDVPIVAQMVRVDTSSGSRALGIASGIALEG